MDPDHSRSGAFDRSFVKVVPSDSFWTACFNPSDPVVDLDIVLPVIWMDGVLEEVDLELDILRFADGNVHVRDQDEFDKIGLDLPGEIAAKAESTCEEVRAMVERGAEPFGGFGREWLSRFLEDFPIHCAPQSSWVAAFIKINKVTCDCHRAL